MNPFLIKPCDYCSYPLCDADNSYCDTCQANLTPIEKLQDFLDKANGITKQPVNQLGNYQPVTLGPQHGLSIGIGPSANTNNILIQTNDAKAECYLKTDKNTKLRCFEKKPNWFVRLMHYYILGIVWKDV